MHRDGGPRCRRLRRGPCRDSAGVGAGSDAVTRTIIKDTSTAAARPAAAVRSLVSGFIGVASAPSGVRGAPAARSGINATRPTASRTSRPRTTRVAALPHSATASCPCSRLIEEARISQTMTPTTTQRPRTLVRLRSCHQRTSCRMKARTTRDAMAAPRMTVLRGDRSFRWRIPMGSKKRLIRPSAGSASLPSAAALWSWSVGP